jgi:hypothetical protein
MRGDLGKAYYLQTLSFDEGDAAKVYLAQYLFVISLIKNKPSSPIRLTFVLATNILKIEQLHAIGGLAQPPPPSRCYGLNCQPGKRWP